MLCELNCWIYTACHAISVTHFFEESKRRKYSALEAWFRFEPIAVETTGVYGVTTASVISELGCRITEVTGVARETFWLQQRIELAIQRGNAFSILTAAARARAVATQATANDHAPIYARSSRLLATIVGVGRSHRLALNFTPTFFIISSIFYLGNLHFGVILLLLDS